VVLSIIFKGVDKVNLSVISFNIRCASDPGGNSIAERAPRLNEVISKYNPDVMGFQEYTPEWKEHIKKYFGKDYDIFNKYRTRFIRRESSPILWKKDKFCCISTGYFWLSDTPEKQSRGWDEKYHCHRICEYVILSELKSGKKFTFMNTHFGFGDNGQKKSAKLIYDYSKKISAYPTFVTGDFNMTPDTPGYAEMTKYFRDANISGRYDYTFHGYNKGKIEPKHIDYCFCDKNVVSFTYDIIKDMPNGKFPSDHYGLVLNLEL